MNQLELLENIFSLIKEYIAEETRVNDEAYNELEDENIKLMNKIQKAIKYCEDSSKTIKSEYFSDILKILKGD